MPAPKDPIKYAEFVEKQRKNFNRSEMMKKRWEDPEYRKFQKESNMGEKNPMYGKVGFNFGKLGKESNNWKGGRKEIDGYVFIYFPEHPFANGKYVHEHRLVAENFLGRYLTLKEVIHHINKIRNDNRPENLYLFKNHSEHIYFHWHPYNLISNLI